MGKNLDVDEPYLDTFSKLFIHFDDVMFYLGIYLDEVYNAMLSYHKKNERYARKILNDLMNDKSQQNLFKKAHNMCDEMNLSKQAYSICYMDCYATRYDSTGSCYIFLFGNLMLRHLNGFVRYAYIKPIFSMRLMGDEWTAKIMLSLQKGTKTAAQLSKELFIPHSSINRYLRRLENELLLYSDIEGRIRYYHINYDYIKYAKPKILRYLDTFRSPINR